MIIATVYVFVVFLTTPPYGVPKEEFVAVVWWVNLLALLVGIVAAALLYRPVRQGVTQVIYGQHDDPYAIIAHLNQRLDASQPPQAILASAAETIAHALRLTYVGIEAHNGAKMLIAEYGAIHDDADVIPIRLAYQGAPVGELRVTPRGKKSAFQGVDLELLNELARQVAIALYATQVTAELQASRESIITAREEERRRIRRDLHDGLGPVLSALQLQLGALRALVRQDPAHAETLATELRDDLRTATAEVRRLVYDLRPPLLDEFGLAGAIRTLAASVPNLTLTVEAPEPMPPLSAAHEVAVFRIAMEAVHNVIKHSGADCCEVTIQRADEQIILTVRDNGQGFLPGTAGGVGFTSMRERAQELGGSISVHSSPGDRYDRHGPHSVYSICTEGGVH